MSAALKLHVFFLLALTLTILPVARASDELLENGNFEEGGFDGWTARNSSVVRSSTNMPAHADSRYSARIGTETVAEGAISQTVSIPLKSKARFTAWYAVEKGSSLKILLRLSDGSLINQWSFDTVTSWAVVTYDLDVSYAGQRVTVEILGHGHTEKVRVQESRCWPGPPPPVCVDFYRMEDKHYHPYVDDVSLTYAVAAYATIVTVTGLPQELSTKLFVDGGEVTGIPGGQTVTRSFDMGETHRVSVDTYVYKDDTIRYYCAQDSETVNSESSLTFSYTPQYYLLVSSPYGKVMGNGWYDTGASARFSVDESLPGPTGADYMLISWKITYFFDHWTGDSSSTDPSDSLIMDGPKTVAAVWRTEKSSEHTLLLAVIGIIATGTAATLIAISKNRPQKAMR